MIKFELPKKHALKRYYQITCGDLPRNFICPDISTTEETIYEIFDIYPNTGIVVIQWKRFLFIKRIKNIYFIDQALDLLDGSENYKPFITDLRTGIVQRFNW